MLKLPHHFFLSLCLLPALFAQQTDLGFNGPIPNTVVFGGPQNDNGESVFVDSAGFISVIGHSESWDFLGLPNPGINEGFIARFRPDGTRLSVNVFNESGFGDRAPHAADADGNFYYATSSVVRLSPDGSSTLYSLPLPGVSQAITVGPDGRAYVVVGTSLISGADHAVVRVSPTGDRIEQQFPFTAGSVTAMALDANGAVYLVGNGGADTPTTPGSLRQSCAGPCGFVIKIPASMDRVEYSTLFSGGLWTNIWSVAADRDGNAYVAGDYAYTGADNSDIPSAAYKGPIWPEIGTGFTAAFVAKLNPTASALVYVHGLVPGSARGVALDMDGSALVAAESYFQRPNDSQSFVGLWRVNPQGAAPTVLTQFSGRWWSSQQYGTSVHIAVDQAGNRFLAAPVAGGFPRTDIPDFPQDAILVKVPANPPTADLAVTIDTPLVQDGRHSPDDPRTDTGGGRYVARINVRNNGPDPAGPFWLHLEDYSATSYEMNGKGARDGKHGSFRVRSLGPGETFQMVMKYRNGGPPQGWPFWTGIVSMTADPNPADEFALFRAQAGAGRTILKVTTDHSLVPLEYFRSDADGALSTMMASPTTSESPVSVWFPPVQYSQGIAWVFTAWSDGSTNPVRTLAATGGTLELAARVTPQRAVDVNPRSLYFVSVAGSVPRPKMVMIGAVTNAAATIAAPAEPWLSASPTSTAPVGVWIVSVNVTGLAPGEYRSSLRVTQAGTPGSTPLPVVLRVLAQAPQITAEGIVDAASYAPCTQAPCKFASIFAPGVGPNEPAVADTTWNNTETGSVGGIDVCVLTYPPMIGKVLYAGTNQLNVAMLAFGDPGTPSGVTCPSYDTGRPGIALVVDGQVISFAQMSSLPLSTIFAPGASIFSLDMSGAGNAVALNADGSLNWAGNPATPGSLVHLYVGAGDTYVGIWPPGFDFLDGLPAVVEIGGKEADIANIGAPEQNLSGLKQLDVFIPDDAPTGPAVPVLVKTIQVGSFGEVTEYPAQANVTLAIRAGPGSANQNSTSRLATPARLGRALVAPAGEIPRQLREQTIPRRLSRRALTE